MGGTPGRVPLAYYHKFSTSWPCGEKILCQLQTHKTFHKLLRQMALSFFLIGCERMRSPCYSKALPISNPAAAGPASVTYSAIPLSQRSLKIRAFLPSHKAFSAMERSRSEQRCLINRLN